MEKFLKKHYRWVVLIIMTFFFTVSVLNARNDSATYDEVAHIPASYSYVTKHDMRLNPEHPPLLKDLVGIPLAFLNLKFDTTEQFWTGEGLDRAWDDAQWSAGRHLLYEAGNNPDQIIFWGRMPIILISILLGLFLFRWGKEISGTLGGLFVLTLYAFDPNILGHNHYVTTDIGIAAFLTFSFYYFLKFIKNPTWKNVLVGGFFLGLVNLVKFSSLMAYPILGLVIIIYPFIKKLSHNEADLQPKLMRLKIFLSYFGKGLVAFVISMLVVWFVYFLNTYNMSHEVIDKQINFSFPINDPNPLSMTTNKALSFLNASSITKPMAEYMLGVTMVFKRVAGGNSMYFLGKVTKNESFAIYFPLVFVIKETLPLLALALFSIIFTIGQIGNTLRKSWPKNETTKHFKHFLQKSVTEYTLFGFIALYAYMSITGNLNIGLRHLFPIIPLTYLLITKKVLDFIRHKHAATKKQLYIIFGTLLIWIILIPILNYPLYTSYFNEVIGGGKNGYKYMTDSNVDWGQDLKRLKIFLNQNPQIEKIHVDYFGGENPKILLGEKFLPWQESKRPIESGWYAISIAYLQTSVYDKNKSTQENYSWTKRYKPVTMIGNSILIYYVPEEQAN